jgi:hypothetical protein
MPVVGCAGDRGAVITQAFVFDQRRLTLVSGS